MHVPVHISLQYNYIHVYMYMYIHIYIHVKLDVIRLFSSLLLVVWLYTSTFSQAQENSYPLLVFEAESCI